MCNYVIAGTDPLHLLQSKIDELTWDYFKVYVSNLTSAYHHYSPSYISTTQAIYFQFIHD